MSFPHPYSYVYYPQPIMIRRYGGINFGIKQGVGQQCHFNIQCPDGYMCGADPKCPIKATYADGRAAPGYCSAICVKRDICPHWWNHCGAGRTCVNGKCVDSVSHKKGGSFSRKTKRTRKTK